MHKKLISFSILCLISISLTGCSPLKNSYIDNKTNNIKESTKDSIAINDKSVVNSIDTSNLDNTKISWFFVPNDEHKAPTVNTDLKFNLNDYNAVYNGPTNKKSKTLYLTFDEGYENGYTPKILDVLKEKNEKAVFFVTSHYIKTNPDLVKRMADEGHIVGNHTMSHPSLPDRANDTNMFNNEFKDVENRYKKVTGKEMVKLFRPPMGQYSQKSLAMTKNLGYTSVFWSFAYHDWDPNEQPNNNDAIKKIMNHLHDGSILLLHAVSKTNTEILGDFIDKAKCEGYKFQLLDPK